MDFSHVPLDRDQRDFLEEIREFLRTNVTEDVLQHDRDTGDNFHERVHLAMGAAGYLERVYRPVSQGGFDAVRRRLWELEIRRFHVPWITWGTTAIVAHSVEQFCAPDLRDDVMAGVFSGHIRMCLGYTEPDGGSDIATCKTRAVRDGDTWIINGSKMFTTGAHNCQYTILITNTDPQAAKHQSLTMFLVPLTTPGIEIHGIRTVDGDRTNIVYYSDVRVDDKYRLGEVNGGWAVLREPLKTEHGAVDPSADGLQDVSIMSHQAGFFAHALDAATGEVAKPGSDGAALVDDASVAHRLGRISARFEAAASTPGIFGRVAVAQMMRDCSPDLMDVLGSPSALSFGTTGAIADGALGYAYRFAPLAGIYGGTLEVFRNMIAQHVLGLGKPNYGPPRAKQTSPSQEANA